MKLYHDSERIAAIVYKPEGKDGALVPFSVFTVDEGRSDGWVSGIYDFDWCHRDEQVYYHCSGSGGSFYINDLSEPEKPPRCAVWWDRALVTPTNDSLPVRKLTPKGVERLGYAVLSAPLMILGKSLNPFDDACEDSVEYCSRCKDHLPTESLCSHIWFCEKCGGYSSPGDRCKHRR